MKAALILLAVALFAGLVVLVLWREAPFDARGSTGAAATATAGDLAAAEPAVEAPAAAYQGFLYGRITTEVGGTYEGRLRFGGGEEAFWGDLFNGYKPESPWRVHVPPELLPRVRRPLELFGFVIAQRERVIDLDRPFVARFGDIARIEARGTDVRVTLKSGTEFDLDRLDASDFDDGVRVWDLDRGVVDLDGLRIRAIDFLPASRPGAAPGRLHGTVRTRQGDFTGFVQWDREKGVGSDELAGRSDGAAVGLRFDSLRAIARQGRDGVRVTRLDGRESVLTGGREVGRDNRGIYVEDRRYGRVLISWGAFERLDLAPAATPGDSGPAYGEFPPGGPLTGSVTTRAGSRLAGRLVYDLDESETTETLDAPAQGVDYMIPCGLIASIALPDGAARDARHVRVTLHGGETLQLERAGDFGDQNAGVLVFVDGRERPEYVPWSDVEQLDFDRPPAFFPPPGGSPRTGGR